MSTSNSEAVPTMTVTCPTSAYDVEVRWQETDRLPEIGKCVWQYCPECRHSHYMPVVIGA